MSFKANEPIEDVRVLSITMLRSLLAIPAVRVLAIELRDDELVVDVGLRGGARRSTARAAPFGRALCPTDGPRCPAHGVVTELCPSRTRTAGQPRLHG